jgi:AcrR family transcriptional regulator
MSADETRQRILERAIEVIDARGEDALRVIEVARLAGVTQGMVTYHFGSRHELVAEAQLVRYATNMMVDVEELASIVHTLHDVDALFAVAMRFTERALLPERVRARRARVSAAGFGVGDEHVRAVLQQAATTAIDGLTAFATAMADRGLLRPGVSPRALATFIQSYNLGLVQWDLDERPVPGEEIVDVIARFMRSVIAID